MKKLFLILIFIMSIFLISSCRLLISSQNTSIYKQFEIYSYTSNDKYNISETIYDLVDEARDEPIIVFPHSRNEMNNIGLVLNKGFLGTFRYSINFGK